MGLWKEQFYLFIKKQSGNTKLLYILNGSIIFGINLLLAYLIHTIPFSENPRIQNNLANIITTELMVFISFFIHNTFTWKTNGRKLTHKLFRYHIVMGGSIILRTISFYVFDRLGLPFMVSTVLSIALIIVFNFLGFDRFVFNK